MSVPAGAQSVPSGKGKWVKSIPSPGGIASWVKGKVSPSPGKKSSPTTTQSVTPSPVIKGVISTPGVPKVLFPARSSPNRKLDLPGFRDEYFLGRAKTSGDAIANFAAHADSQTTYPELFKNGMPTFDDIYNHKLARDLGMGPNQLKPLVPPPPPSPAGGRPPAPRGTPGGGPPPAPAPPPAIWYHS